jgi:hypothetical protein
MVTLPRLVKRAPDALNGYTVSAVSETSAASTQMKEALEACEADLSCEARGDTVVIGVSIDFNFCRAVVVAARQGDLGWRGGWTPAECGCDLEFLSL